MLQAQVSKLNEGSMSKTGQSRASQVNKDCWSRESRQLRGVGGYGGKGR